MKMMTLPLGNIILLKEKRGMRESILKQIDKKSRVPKEEKGIQSPQEGERAKKKKKKNKEGERALEF